jgi:hypothetical protein
MKQGFESFHNHWVHRVMAGVTLVRYSVRFNGAVFNILYPFTWSTPKYQSDHAIYHRRLRTLLVSSTSIVTIYLQLVNKALPLKEKNNIAIRKAIERININNSS